MMNGIRRASTPFPDRLPGAVLICLLTGCQTGPVGSAAGSAASAPPTEPAGAPTGHYEQYLEALDGMARGDILRQQATLQAARSAWQQAPTPPNTLRYALVLGTPGHDDSNPLEASRLLADLLAAPERLSADELRLAAAFQREFTARVSQYAELARMRLDVEARIRATEAETQTRINVLAADVARLRRERDAIQEKLDAITDIEKSLMERDDTASATPDSTDP